MANPTNSEKLDSLLGFDAGKKPSVTQTVFEKALAEISKKREEEALGAAMELLEKAMALKAEHARRVREFESASKGFEKELGKVIGKLSRFIPGGPPQVPEGEGEASSDESSSEE